MIKISTAKKVTNEVMNWGVLAMVIVVIAIVLSKFKGITGITSAVNSSIDTFITAILEPKNWVSIVIIVVIAAGIIMLFKGAFDKRK
jgi:hypothetical protein